MRWVRDAGWVVAACLAVVLLKDWLPKKKELPDPQETRDAHNKLRAEFEEKQAKRAEAFSRVQTEGTLEMLRSAGRAYLRGLAVTKTPPSEEDFREVIDLWRSRRDEKPFVIQWGVDLSRLPEGGAGVLLAWEQSPDDKGQRAVLMADGKTAKVVTSDEFERLPRAK